MPVADISTVDIMKIVLGSGVTTAVITTLAGIAKDRLADKRAASHAAVRLATILETYMLACAAMISDANTFWQSNGSAGSLHGRLPELQPYPDDIEWKLLPAHLVSAVLALPNEVTLANQSISSTWEVGDEQDTNNACMDDASKTGLFALDLARGLRRKYGLPDFALHKNEWNPETTLRSADRSERNAIEL